MGASRIVSSRSPIQRMREIRVIGEGRDLKVSLPVSPSLTFEHDTAGGRSRVTWILLPRCCFSLECLLSCACYRTPRRRLPYHVMRASSLPPLTGCSMKRGNACGTRISCGGSRAHKQIIGSTGRKSWGPMPCHPPLGQVLEIAIQLLGSSPFSRVTRRAPKYLTLANAAHR